MKINKTYKQNIQTKQDAADQLPKRNLQYVQFQYCQSEHDTSATRTAVDEANKLGILTQRPALGQIAATCMRYTDTSFVPNVT
jgi:hypothetical protein